MTPLIFKKILVIPHAAQNHYLAILTGMALYIIIITLVLAFFKFNKDRFNENNG